MGNSEIMREYLVRLGYQTDVVSLRRFEDNLGRTSKRLLKVGSTVAGIATSIGAATTAFSYHMRRMYFASELANSSVKNLNAMGYAGKQIGISGDAMESAIKGMAQAFRLNPGMKALIESFGIKVSGRDVSDVMVDTVEAFSKMPEWQGIQFAQMFGLDPDTYHMMITHLDTLKQKKEEDLAIFKKMNVDVDASKSVIMEYTSTLDRLGEEFEAVGTKILLKLVPAFKEATEWTDKLLEGTAYGLDHLDQEVGAWWEKDPMWLKTMFGKAKSSGLTDKVSGTAESVMDFFIKKGWSSEQSAGIAANLHAESGLNHSARGDSGKAYGLGQWHPDRQRKFAAWAGHPITTSTMQEQLAFVDWELKNTEKMAGSKLRGARSAGEAGALVSKYYERPADTSGAMAYRSGLAESFATKLGSGSSSGVTLHQETNINVQGGDSESIGKTVAKRQDEVNRNLVRNFSGAPR